MSQSTVTLPTIGIVSGLTFALDANAALDAIRTCWSGSSAPAGDVPELGQFWLDTSTSPNPLRQYTGSVWVIKGYIDVSNGVWVPVVSGGGIPTIASATTTNLGALANPQGSVTISGTTTITSFGSSANLTTGQVFFVRFSGALQLTNSGSLILPNGVNITTASGDCLIARYEGSGNWRVISYTISGSAGVALLKANNLSELASAPAAAVANLGISAPHCGRMIATSSTQLKFSPFNGDVVQVNGSQFQIPSGGITAANTSIFIDGVGGSNLAASTTYYCYLFNNSGTLTFDFSTTGHQTDVTAGNIGVEIKTGVTSRTLIGMVHTNGSSQFVPNNNIQIVVLSWFNRQPLFCNASLGNTTTTSTTRVNVYGVSLQIMNWSDCDVEVWYGGQTDTSGAFAGMQILFDGVNNIGLPTFCYGLGTISGFPTVVGGFLPSISEGGHLYAYYLGCDSGSGTASSLNASLIARTWG